MFLPHSTLEERTALILIEQTKQELQVDPISLGRHSSVEVLFKCVVCQMPHKLSKKRILDGKGLSHSGSCRQLFKRSGGQRARQNEDPQNKAFRAEQLRKKMRESGPEIVSKRQQTLVVKYGSKNISEIESIRNNIAKGARAAHLTRGSDIVAIRQATNMQRYGSSNFLTSQEGILHVQEASMRLFGTLYPFQNKEHRLKSIDYQVKKLVSGLPAHEYIEQHSNSNHINRYLAYKILENEGEDSFKKFCDKMPHRTMLEYKAQSLLGADFFNAFPLPEVRYKPDLKITHNDSTIFVNVDGLYWHSELEKDHLYHMTLATTFRNHNLRLLQFREDEIYYKGDIIKSIVEHAIGKPKHKVNARSGSIAKVNQQTARRFFEENHLMGFANATTYGLYLKEELVAAISIKMLHNQTLDIVRFASKKFYSVRGGFSKLLAHAIKIHNPTTVQSFCDLRYASGESYIKNGFQLESTTLSWQWTDFKNTFNRLKCTANMDDRKLTQSEHAEELGWYKIYDAGQAKYVKVLK
jgi:hypothetical protein